MKKMGSSFDVANAVLFLASDEAKYITGTEIVVDGGSLMYSRTTPSIPETILLIRPLGKVIGAFFKTSCILIRSSF